MKPNQKKPRIIIPELIKKKGNKDRDLDVNKQNIHGLDNVEHCSQQGKTRSLNKISSSLIVKAGGEHACGGSGQVRQLRDRPIKKHSLNHVAQAQTYNVVLPEVKFKVSQFLDESNCNQSGLHSISNYHIISNYNSQYNPGQQSQSPDQIPYQNPQKSSSGELNLQKSQEKDQTQRTSLQTYNQINISNSNLNLNSNPDIDPLKDCGQTQAQNRIKTAVGLEKLESLLKSDRMFVNPDKWGQYVQRALGDEKFHKALNVFLYSYFIQNYN